MIKSESLSQPANLSMKDLETLRSAYQALPQMIAYEGQKPWNAFSVFIQLAFVLAAGAIVPSFIPEPLSKIALAFVGITLSLTGIVAALVWFSFDKRFRKITMYWILSMREIEDKLSGTLEAFQKGRDFSQGETVIVSGEPIQYENFKRLSERTGFRIIYTMFIIVFVILLGLNIYRLLIALQILPAV